MKLKALVALALAAQLTANLAANPGGPALAADPGWPRELTSGQSRLVFYEPQVDAWKDFRDLDFRLAFELTPAGGKPAVGIGEIHARTDVDVDRRRAVIRDMKVVETRFPSSPPEERQRLDALFRKFVAERGDIPISLDRLVAVTEKPQAAPNAVAVRNDPPAIFVSYQPSVLLQTDGKPVAAAAGKAGGVEFIVNANWPVFHVPADGKYYLFDDTMWLSAARLEGPWAAAGPLPRVVTQVLSDPEWAGLKKASSTAPGKAKMLPAVFFSSTPAEVIMFDGKPIYSPIAGTGLVFAKNTDADLFVDQHSNSYYFLAAGRWFRATSLDGPWTFASNDLPADFAKIPQDSPAARVLASVPGTEAAKDAVLLAQVPTRVTLDPKEAAKLVDVSYDGQPEFKPIEGTSMQYAVNTPDRIIKVDNQYYLCESGVWFQSATPTGPWTTAPSVPSQIYTIPPSSPVYNVTYVTQTTTSSGYVDASYTAGYFGTFIMGMAVGAIIADGSGYWYPPHYHYPAYGGYPVYRPYAATYGAGSFYNPYTGAHGASRGVYGPYRGATGSASYNPYTGTAAATRQASSVYGNWGSSVVQRGATTTATRHASTARGTAGAAHSSTGAAAVAGSGARGTGGAVRTAGGDLYAGKDGNVYRRSGGSWQRYDNGNWSSTAAQTRSQGRDAGAGAAGSSALGSATGSGAGPRTGAGSAGAARARPTAQTASSSVPQSLNRDYQDRQRGAAQSQRFNSVNSSRGGGSFGGRGGGGFGGGRGGGGRGGRGR